RPAQGRAQVVSHRGGVALLHPHPAETLWQATRAAYGYGAKIATIDIRIAIAPDGFKIVKLSCLSMSHRARAAHLLYLPQRLLNPLSLRPGAHAYLSKQDHRQDGQAGHDDGADDGGQLQPLDKRSAGHSQQSA